MAEQLASVEERLVEIICKRFAVPADEVALDTPLRDMKVDSLATVELSLALQREFGVRFKPGEINSGHSLGDLTAMLQEKGAAS
ncbi:acyl carrier protein [Kitasatospora azatica]|uniref:acyl carrier protein n=1 Tax=Kitasatospora azatica TaxID=58347 RepID=UPI000567A890|nr:acyl carrier protein [Kitasatospora azatica]